MSSSSQIDTQFSGISNTSTYPPHNGLAVGPGYVVMAEGSRIEWTNLTGGAATLQSVYSFFGSLGTTATNSLYDPRCIYDSVSGRFIIIMENLGSNGAVSSIDIAVSKDSNPNDGWYFTSLNTALTINGQATASDRATVSVDANNIYISAPQYNNSGGGWQGTESWVIGKTAGAGAGLYNGGTMTVVANQISSPNQGIFTVTAGNNGKTYYASDYSTGSQIVIALQTYDTATNAFGPVATVSLGNIDQGGTYTAQQQGTTLLLDAGDKRIQNLVYSNGFLYGVAEEKPIGSSVPLVHWFKIDVSNPNSPTLAAQGDISGASLGANVSTFNGSIAVSGAGDIIINFTASGPSMYPSDYYVFQSGTDPIGSFSGPILYQASTGFFNAGNGSTTQRWGAYSTAIADPNNPHAFWISNEYVANNWWQTSVAEIEVKSSGSATVTSIATSGPGISGGSGVLNAGNVVTLTVSFSSPVIVNTTGGSPTLALNDGGSASYASGSGSNALVFSYTVVAGQNTADLVVSSLSLNGATIRDGAGSAADLSGATNYNSTGILQIDTTTPAAPTGLSLDPTTDSGTVGDGITNFPQVKIDGTAEAGSTVTLYDSNGSTVIGTGVANATTGAFVVTTSTLSSGNHMITAKATDAAGNLSTASTGYTVTINNTGPGAPTGLALDTTTDSGVKGDAITNFAQAKIDGTAGAGTTVTLYDSNGTTVLGTGVADTTTGAFSIATSSLSNGTHNITAKATDSGGNSSAPSTVYALTIDSAAPAAPTGLSLDTTTDSGTKGDGITNFSQVKIDGTAEPGSTVTLYDTNGTSVLGTGVANATTGAFGITTSTLSSGNHTITAKAADAAGNVGVASAGYAVAIDSAAPAAPTALSLDTTTDSGTKGDGITNFSQAKIDGTAEPGSTVTLYDTNGTSVIGTGVANVTGGAFSITTSTLSSGSHTITAKATDTAGNLGAASVAYAITIDTAAPAAPTGLSLDSTTDSGTKGDGITNFSQVKINGTADPGSTVTLYDTNGTSVIGTGVANATTGAFSITTSTLSSGSHTISAKATDTAGNVGAASVTYAVAVDTAAPAAPTGMSLDSTTDSGTKGDGITNFTQVKIDGAAEPGSTLTLYDTNGTTVIGTGVANATTGAFSVTTSTLSSGNHTITAKATDAAGNVSAASAGYAVTVTTSSTGTYDHILVVVEENHGYADIIGSSAAPYLNSLAAQGVSFTDFHGEAHPSQPNYLALFSGSTQGVTDDNSVFFPTTPTLAGELLHAGYSFTGYAEASKTGYHDPWEQFGESQNLGKDFGQFPTDFTQLPTVSFVVPNVNDDMHNGTVAQGDQWLSTNLSAYANWAMTHNSLLVVTWDEDDGSSSNLIPTIVVGAGIPAGQNSQTVNHYSLLHTIENAYGLPGLTSNDINAPLLNLGPATPPTGSSEIDTQFSGISDTSDYPPHNALAVGPNNVVMLEGSKIEWTNLTGGSPTVQSKYQFFSSLGAAATNALFDPRAVYDPINKRYVVTIDNLGPNGATSNIDIAVSKTSNPNDGWYFASLNTTLTINGQTTVSDTPVVSVDGANIYITAPQYNVSGGGWGGTAVWVVGDTAGSGGGIYNGGTLSVVANEVTSSSQGIYRVVAGNNGKAYYASSFSSASSNQVLTLQVYDVASKTFGPISTVSLGNIDQGGSYTAQQKGTSLLLDATDKRVQNLVYSNGFLWGVTEEKPIGSTVPLVHWFKLDVSNPNSPTLVAQGDISGTSIGSNVATFNGSIAVDAAGDVLINFTASGPNNSPSDYYVFHAGNDPSGAFSAPTLYQASSGFFDSGNGSSTQRWGLNSTTIADPANSHSFWVSNEYIANGWWQTAVAQVEILPSPEPPTLTLNNTALTVPAGGSVALGVHVTPVDADDTVSVTINGLTGYETITDGIDQSVFSGSSVTLSAAQVNSGLTLHSSYTGSDHPVNNLALTASNTTSGEAATTAAQTIVVTDPPVQTIIADSSTIGGYRSQNSAPAIPTAPGFGPGPSSPYTALASVFSQYMAAAEPSASSGISPSLWMTSRQGLFGEHPALAGAKA